MKSNIYIGTSLIFELNALQKTLNYEVASSIKFIEPIFGLRSVSIYYLIKFFILTLLFSHNNYKNLNDLFNKLINSSLILTSLTSSFSKLFNLNIVNV